MIGAIKSMRERKRNFMKQTSFSVFCVKLFMGSVFGIFVCFCIDRILNIQQANFWQSLFMAVVYLFMYSIFPYYVASRQADQDRKILRYKEHYPEEIPYSIASLQKPRKGLKAGLIVMIPHMLTTIIPFLTFWGVTENINSIYHLLNIHLRELIDFDVPTGTNGTWLGMIFLVAYQFILPLVSHFGYYTTFREIPVVYNILYKKDSSKKK